MNGTILLDYGENIRAIEDEEKSRFLRSILEQSFEATEVIKELQDIWQDNVLLSPAQKIKLRSILSQYKILVRDDHDGGLKIYLEKQLIGSFTKPRYTLKKEPHAIEPNKRYFLEMHVSCWSLFDQETEEAQEITNQGS